jgi:fumarylacetoacetate (FAA) hydrolase
MKLISYRLDRAEHLGLLYRERVFDLHDIDQGLPATMDDFLKDWDHWADLTRTLEKKLEQTAGIAPEKLELLAPVPRPGSLRDGYAFRQHVETARRNRKVPMIPAFDEYPVFYFSNHRTVVGPGELRFMPDHFDKLDFELEAAVVLSKGGRNIRAADADHYIGGLMIMNDFSARTLQMEEMLLNLGPAKGKDFATALGPWLVTPDELAYAECPPPPGHTGRAWNLQMKASVNGQPLSEGSLGDMNWTFAEIIERASYGVDLYPGDLIGSGTVGTGCLLELNGTARLKDPGAPEQWLQPGDRMEMEIEGLGKLSNTLLKTADDFSILKNKKINISH